MKAAFRPMRGAMLHALWSHETSAGWRTLHQRSFDGGATWLPPAQVVKNGAHAIAGGDVATLFVADAFNAPLATVLRSIDAGATWTPVSGLFDHSAARSCRRHCLCGCLRPGRKRLGSRLA